jgi:hypothetical protein
VCRFRPSAFAPHELRAGTLEPRAADAPGGGAQRCATRHSIDRGRDSARSGSPRRITPTIRPRPVLLRPVPRHRARRDVAGSRSGRPTAGSCDRSCASRAAELERYAAARELGWREDSSNACDDYARNRLRSLLPALARDFNPRLLRAIADLAEAQQRMASGSARG